MGRIDLHALVSGLGNQVDRLRRGKPEWLDLFVSAFGHFPNGFAQIFLDRIAKGVKLQSDPVQVGQGRLAA